MRILNRRPLKGEMYRRRNGHTTANIWRVDDLLQDSTNIWWLTNLRTDDCSAFTTLHINKYMEKVDDNTEHASL